MQSWGAWAQYQALYYMKNGKKTSKRRQWRRLRSPQPALSWVSRVPEVLLLLSSPPHHWTQPHHQPQGGHKLPDCLGSKYACILHPGWGHWSVRAISNLKTQDTDLDKTTHEAQHNEPQLSVQGDESLEVEGSPVSARLALVCRAQPASAARSASPAPSPSWTRAPQLLGRLPSTNPSPAKPPCASVQSCPRWHPSFHPSYHLICFCLKTTSSRTGRTKLVFLQILCSRLVDLNSWWVGLLTSNGPWHGRSMTEDLSETPGALRGTGSSVPSDALTSTSIPQPTQRNGPNCHTLLLDLQQLLVFPVILLMRWIKLSPLFRYDLGDTFP